MLSKTFRNVLLASVALACIGSSLLIMIAVLFANFMVDIAYGFIDPRIRASAVGER